MPARGSPNSLTIDQLTRELKLRNVTLPKSSIRKEVLVDLYKKHVLSDSVANSPDVYSSDDDDPQQSTLNDNQSYDNQEMTEADILSLSDSDLRAKLKSYDENVGPITNSTRSVYRKKLAKYISGELSAPNLNTSSAPVTTAYSDDDDEGDVEEEGSHVSTHDVSVQNDFDYQENGDDQPDEDVEGGSRRMTKHVREVIETRYTEAVHNSSQPTVSSLWMRRYEEDKNSSTGGSSRSRRPLLAGRNAMEELSHNTARKGIYDDMFSSGDVRTTPTTDFHRRSLALHGLTPRPPISSYSPSRSTPSCNMTYYQGAGDNELRHRVHQASSRSLKKAKAEPDNGFYKFLIAVLIVVLLSLFGYVVYLNLEPGYLPKLL